MKPYSMQQLNDLILKSHHAQPRGPVTPNDLATIARLASELMELRLSVGNTIVELLRANDPNRNMACHGWLDAVMPKPKMRKDEHWQRREIDPPAVTVRHRNGNRLRFSTVHAQYIHVGELLRLNHRTAVVVQAVNHGNGTVTVDDATGIHRSDVLLLQPMTKPIVTKNRYESARSKPKPPTNQPKTPVPQ